MRIIHLVLINKANKQTRLIFYKRNADSTRGLLISRIGHSFEACQRDFYGESECGRIETIHKRRTQVSGIKARDS